MPQKLKKGDRIYVTEGPQQGQQGIVTQVRRIFDEDDKKTRWVVWADSVAGEGRIKTRLAWCREI